MQTVAPDKMVTIRYRMRTHLPDGTDKEHPRETIRFVFGVERQVPTLEKALSGRKPGDRIEIEIPSSEIYGEHDPMLVKEIPKQGLLKQRLREGDFYRQMKRGCLLSFKVLEIRPHTVLADFNRPMAGITVTMELEVMALRDATEEETRLASDAQIKKSIGCG